MRKNGEFYNAGENAFHRWGKKAREKLENYLKPNDKGYYVLPVDGGKYWTIGTSVGQYGEFAKYKDTYFSVNSWGFIYAKEGTEKAEVLLTMIKSLIEQMKKYQEKLEEEHERSRTKEEEEEKIDEWKNGKKRFRWSLRT